ncbi:MAG: FHA domain-containing protein [Planctomycetota bacterium]|jgi:predicted component of type VI protein secretion system
MRLRRRDTDETRELTAGMTLGRLPSCDWSLDDASISRKHAEVREEGGQWWLVDLGSSNGSQVNGRKGERHRLRGGDLLTLGTVAFEIQEDAPPAQEPVAAATRSNPAAARAAEPAAEAPAPSRSQEADRERARLRQELRGDRRSRGFGDLSQQPLGIKLLALLICGAVMVGIVYGIRFLGGFL